MTPFLFALLLFAGLNCCLAVDENIALYQCDEGWTIFNHRTCLKVTETRKSYRKAERACAKYGGRLLTLLSVEKEGFLYDNAMVTEEKYWMGLSRQLGSFKYFEWQLGPVNKPMKYTNFASRHGNYGFTSSFERRCGYLLTAEQKWFSTSDCSEELHYICERNSMCVHGHFGEKCEHLCHCHGETCDRHTGMCKYGCEKNWFGPRCNKEKTRAEVAYYCFMTEDKGPQLLFRVNPRGVTYQVLEGLDGNDDSVNDCRIDTFSLDNITGVYSRDVYLKDIQQGPTHCGAKKTGDTTWIWRFALREHIGVVSSHDVTVKVTCDFSKADKLMREGDQSLEGNVAVEVDAMDESREEVKLTVVDSFSNLELKDIELGSNVKLRLQLHKKEGFAAKAVSPYGCAAFSEDRKFTLQLTDSHGCAVTDSPVSPMKGSNSSAVTEVFQMFTFPGISVVNFRCQYDFCFKDETRCRDRCFYFSSNDERTERRRRSGTEKNKPVYTSVNVLPQHDEEMDVNPPPDKLRGVPLLYLNPITCSMFLFLLSVFLLYYVFFIKSLKKSVEEMKEELKLQNRWQRI